MVTLLEFILNVTFKQNFFCVDIIWGIQKITVIKKQQMLNIMPVASPIKHCMQPLQRLRGKHS